MPKIVNFSAGDVFLIPLYEDFFGIGRIIVRSNDTCLIEFYQIEPLRRQQELLIEEIYNLRTVLTEWVYDDYLKNGDWPITGNIPISEDYVYPNFWRKTVDNKFFLIPGTCTYLGDIEKMREISEEEIDNLSAQRYGIMSPESTPSLYLRALQESSFR